MSFPFLYHQCDDPSTLTRYNEWIGRTYEDVLGRWAYAGTKDPEGDYHSYDDYPVVIDEDKTRRWYRHGERHRNNDQPAVILADGSEKYYSHGIAYRIR